MTLAMRRTSAKCPGNGFNPFIIGNAIESLFRESYWQWQRKCVWERKPLDVFTPCPEGGLTNGQGTSQMSWEWIYPTHTGDSTPHLPMDVFIPCPEAGLTNNQRTKQRRRKGPFEHQGRSVPDSLDTVSQVSPGNGHVGWLCVQKATLPSISVLTKHVLMKDFFHNRQVVSPTLTRAWESVMQTTAGATRVIKECHQREIRWRKRF